LDRYRTGEILRLRSLRKVSYDPARSVVLPFYFFRTVLHLSFTKSVCTGRSPSTPPRRRRPAAKRRERLQDLTPILRAIRGVPARQAKSNDLRARVRWAGVGEPTGQRSHPPITGRVTRLGSLRETTALSGLRAHQARRAARMHRRARAQRIRAGHSARRAAVDRRGRSRVTFATRSSRRQAFLRVAKDLGPRGRRARRARPARDRRHTTTCSAGWPRPPREGQEEASCWSCRFVDWAGRATTVGGTSGTARTFPRARSSN